MGFSDPLRVFPPYEQKLAIMEILKKLHEQLQILPEDDTIALFNPNLPQSLPDQHKLQRTIPQGCVDFIAGMLLRSNWAGIWGAFAVHQLTTGLLSNAAHHINQL